MIRALLIDLDDTLLQSNFDELLAAYLDRLSDEFTELAPKEQFIAQLLAGTQRMIDNLDPTMTLKAAFDGAFYPALGTSEAEIRDDLLNFYDHTYPTLRDLTSPIEGAQELVKNASASDRKVVIATNPLFPRRALEHRLSWANIDLDQVQVDLITSYETMHFAKPHPEYFAEILGLLGISAHEAAMIGDDLTQDIEPANVLGMAALHHPFDGRKNASPGTLPGLINWVDERASAVSESLTAHQPRAVLARMRAHLSALLTLTEELETVDDWNTRPGKTAWAPVEIVCHLRDVDREVNLPRLAKVLAEEGAFVPAVNPDSWADPRRYIDQSGPAALEGFTAARLELIAQLAVLDEEQWQRPARHALLGPTTLSELLGVVADHDLLHLDQLRSALPEPFDPFA